jgi:diacylglycerol kinase (ATP)
VKARVPVRTSDDPSIRIAEIQRGEEASASRLERRLTEAQFLRPLSDTKPEVASAPLSGLWPDRRAMLIINSKSGPNHDSLLRVRELVEHLAHFGIHADVRVKLRKSQARKEARAAAMAGYELVIAAGGDGTVEAVARGLLRTQATLGIVPLGTYNNVATSLGIPTDVRQACALIAVGGRRRLDVGLVKARHMKKSRIFLEMSTVGLGAALGPVGQHVEKGRWQQAAEALPTALQMRATSSRLRLDGEANPHNAHTLLITISNTPRAGAGLEIAPGARVDDGLLDVTVYEDMDRGAIMAQFLPPPLMSPTDNGHDSGVRRTRARQVEIRTARPMPVAIGAKLVGVTPARFSVLAQALTVVVGNGRALLNPTSDALVAACVSAADGIRAADERGDDLAVQATTDPPRALQIMVPVLEHMRDVGPTVGSLGGPALMALAGIAVGSLLPPVFKRRRR